MYCRNFAVRHVLLEVMFYLRVCIIGGHDLLFEMSYWGTCFFKGGYILQDDMLYRVCPISKACIT